MEISGTNIHFTPYKNYSGEASFEYTVSDNGTTAGIPDAKSSTATVTFHINHVNSPPVVSDYVGDTTVMMNGELVGTITATDADGDILTYDATDGFYGGIEMYIAQLPNI